MDPDLPIIALDFSSQEEAEDILEQLAGEQLNVKVGMELYYQTGPDFLKKLKAAGHHIFLDLKLHDIPNTVARTVRSLASLGVDMIDLHASGGYDMMKLAVSQLKDIPEEERPKLLAITQLTSTTEVMMKRDQLVEVPLEESVVHLAKSAQSAGVDGVVCSPLEAGIIKERVGDSFLTVTPGIRLPESEADDQQRVTTPEKAQKKGSDFIVVGRPITRAKDVKAAYHEVKSRWNNQ